jgi:hypothetical protein
MKRTKYEIDLLAEIILDKVKEARLKKLNSGKRAIVEYATRKGYLKKYRLMEAIDTEIASLNKQREKIRHKLEADLGRNTVFTETLFFKSIGRKLFGFEEIKVEDIQKEILLSSDQGADILVKNLVKQFA